MLNKAFDSLLAPEVVAKQVDLFPAHLDSSFKEMNDWVYNKINNGMPVFCISMCMSVSPYTFCCDRCVQMRVCEVASCLRKSI